MSAPLKLMVIKLPSLVGKTGAAVTPLPAALVSRGASGRDANRQALGYFYFAEEPGRRSAAKLLTIPTGKRGGSSGYSCPYYGYGYGCPSYAYGYGYPGSWSGSYGWSGYRFASRPFVGRRVFASVHGVRRSWR
jgi:hypothetical protein